MKIRNKQTGQIVEKAVEGMGAFSSYYVVPANYGVRLLYDNACWEPVPEERWANVTGECEILPNLKFRLPGNDTDYSKYRMRMVISDPEIVRANSSMYAVIIEKRIT